jgi:hypothetical protein
MLSFSSLKSIGSFGKDLFPLKGYHIGITALSRQQSFTSQCYHTWKTCIHSRELDLLQPGRSTRPRHRAPRLAHGRGTGTKLQRIWFTAHWQRSGYVKLGVPEGETGCSPEAIPHAGRLRTVGDHKHRPIGVKLRNSKMGSMAASRAPPRAGASPAPTIHGWAFRSCIVGATLAVALEAGLMQEQIVMRVSYQSPQP